MNVLNKSGHWAGPPQLDSNLRQLQRSRCIRLIGSSNGGNKEKVLDLYKIQKLIKGSQFAGAAVIARLAGSVGFSQLET
jgi:hypothetical protein